MKHPWLIFLLSLHKSIILNDVVNNTITNRSVFFRINSVNPLEWKDDDDDLSLFVVICVERESLSGFTTCGYSNNHTNKRSVTEKFTTTGHYAIQNITSFDLLTETDIKHLKKGNKVINKKALVTYIKANNHRPHSIAFLEPLIEDDDETSRSGYLSP